MSLSQINAGWILAAGCLFACNACGAEAPAGDGERVIHLADLDAGRDLTAEPSGARRANAARAESARNSGDAPPTAAGGSAGAGSDAASAQPPDEPAAQSAEQDDQDDQDDQDAGVADGSEHSPATKAYVLQLPAGFPEPVIPAENLMSEAKVELGRRLFYDKRLSNNQTQSCGSCHVQELAFTDGKAVAVGSTGELHPRSSQPLFNLAFSTSLTWANPLFAIGVLPEPLERQSQLPIYGDSPVELGQRSQGALVTRLSEVALYRELFAEAFPDEQNPVTALNVGRALAAFERTIVSGNSRYDQYLQGDDGALSESEQRGYSLFTSSALECSSCHSGFNLTEHVHSLGKPTIELVYRNTGLYNLDGMGAYPVPNTGAFNVTMNPDDMGKFRVPSLRNIAVTAPYMHDGSIETLSQVIDHYAAGGRTIADGPNAGVGRENPLKDPRVQGFEISEDERKDLIAFLESLTDDSFLTNPAFGDPWLSE